MNEASLTALRIERRFDVPPESVFDAWTRAEVARAWLFTAPNSERHAAEIDPRPGGRWTITDRREGADYLALGQYRVFDRPHRLVTSFAMPQFSPESAELAVEIAPDGAGSRMVLVQDRLPAAAAAAAEKGWNAMFDQLAKVLAG